MSNKKMTTNTTLKRKAYAYSFINHNTGETLLKHWNFYQQVLARADRQSDTTFFHFGGGINGGKTYTCLLCLLKLAEKYPGSRWHVVRRNYPALVKTTIESAKKLFGKAGSWYMGKDDLHFRFKNGSRVHFLSENFDSDKTLNHMLGLETNGFLLEQIEELQELCWQRAIQRAGRWKIAGETLPPPIIMTTFNPTPLKWVRDLVYVPTLGLPRPKTYIQFVTVRDNPFATKEEIEMLDSMDSKHKAQMVDGSWEEFTSTNTFAYAFSKEKHCCQFQDFFGSGEMKDVYLSFDFNYNPMTCLVAYLDNDCLYILKEFREPFSSIHKMCNVILEYLKTINYNYVFVTGDGSGWNASGLTDYTYYDVIMQKLDLHSEQLNLKRANMRHKHSRMIVNYLFEKLDVKIDESCVNLIQDLQVVEVDDTGSIKKDDATITHFLDCFRYFCNNYFKNHLHERLYGYAI